MATVVQKTISIKGGQKSFPAGTSYTDDTAFTNAYNAEVAGLDAPGRVDHSTYVHEYVRVAQPAMDPTRVAELRASGVIATV